MYVLCNTIVDKTPWIVIVNVQGEQHELYKIADNDDFTLHSFLVRNIYNILLNQIGLRGAIYIVDIEWDDSDLLEFLVETHSYPYYDGEIGDL